MDEASPLEKYNILVKERPGVSETNTSVLNRTKMFQHPELKWVGYEYRVVEGQTRYNTPLLPGLSLSLLQKQRESLTPQAAQEFVCDCRQSGAFVGVINHQNGGRTGVSRPSYRFDGRGRQNARENCQSRVANWFSRPKRGRH